MTRVSFRGYRYLAFAFTVLIVVAVISGCGGKGGGY
jgi:predicted small lipoprotein YifL